MAYDIRLMCKEDISEAIEVCIKCFGEDWRKIAEVDFPQCVGDYPYKPNCFIAKHKNKIIGMSFITPVMLTPDTYSVTWLCVEKKI